MQHSKQVRTAKDSHFEPEEYRSSGVQKFFQLKRWLLGSLVLLSGLSWSQAVRAEGSVDLTENQGFRPFLEYRSDATAGIPRRSIIKAYAETGETINLASSAIGVGAGDILYRAPDGTTNTCRVVAPGTGFIPNRNAEVAGPGAGYNPCQIQVGANQTGVWEIEFISPNEGAIAPQFDPVPTPAAGPWAQPNNIAYISAWDVTVTEAGQPISGRVYANYLALNVGGNGRDLSSVTYIQTEEGYLYRIRLNTIDPYAFIFFANNKGFRDPATGASRYASINADLNGNGISTDDDLVVAGILQGPGEPDTPTDVTHKIFFNPPNPDLPASALDATPTGITTTWLRNPPDPIPNTANFNFRFEGIQGTPNQAGPTLGGNFIFDASGAGNYFITIDANRDGVVGDPSDVILRGPATPGRNTVFWNGTDALGNPLPAGTTPYDAVLTFFVGDVHFPFLDPENNPLGIVIERVDPASLAVENSRVFYNDSPLPLVGVPPTPISALNGVLSSPQGAHSFNNLFGDNRGIDTWTSLAEPLTLTGGILIQKADLSILKTDNPDPLAAGQSLTYSIAVTSNQPPAGDIYTPVRGARVTDTVPPQITGVTWTCAITTGTGACSTASGTGNNIDLTVDLDVGATATITVNGTVALTALGALTNTASVAGPPDVTDPNPDNNTDTEDTTVLPGPVQPAGEKSVRLATDVDNSRSLTTGDIVEYTVRYINTSAQDIIGFQATDTINTSQLTYVNGSYTFSASGLGTTVSANPNFNGTTDINLSSLGTLGANGGQVVTRFRAVVIAPAGSQIANQAIATSANGTVNPSITDAATDPDPSGIPQIENDQIEQGNLPNLPGDDEPTIINVVGSGGEARLRLLKRITNVTRGGVPLSGIDFGSVVANTDDANAPGWSQLPGGAPVGLENLGSEASVQSGDEVEYTVYFLSDGPQTARTVRLCDAIPSDTAYSPGSISLTLPTVGLSNQTQTDALGDDRGSFVPALNVSPPFSSPPCPNPSNPNGAVLVDLGDIPNTAPSNVGFVRFRVRID